MAYGSLLLVCAAGAYGMLLPRQNVDLAKFVRGTPEAARGIRFWSRGEFSEQLPYSEVELFRVPEIKVPSVSPDKQKCFYLRRAMDPKNSKVGVDIENPSQDAQLVSAGLITVTQSVAKIDNTRIGWSTEKGTEIGGSAGVSLTAEAGIPGFGSVSSTATLSVYGNQRWSSGANGDKSTTTEIRTDVSYQGTCPPDSTCTVVTWTYSRTINGRCYTMPLVDATCYNSPEPTLREPENMDPNSNTLFYETNVDFNEYKDNKPLNGNISIAALAPLGDSNIPNLNWTSTISDLYWNFNIRPVRRRDVKTDPKMHEPWDVSGNKFDSDCSFRYTLFNNNKPVTTQAMLVERDGQDQSPPPMDFQASQWNDKLQLCELQNGWRYTATATGYYYSGPAQGGKKREWLNQLARPRWPKEPKDLLDKCPKTRRPEGVSARAEDQTESYLDRIVVIEDELEGFIEASDANKDVTGFLKPETIKDQQKKD